MELDMQSIPPSAFVAMGQPCCSRWAKSEIEWLALAYVQALAQNGDTWKRLSRERVYELLTEKQRQYVYGMLTRDFDIYKGWFDGVSNLLTSAERAFSVGGFWNDHQYKKTCGHSATYKP